ncbi:MAG: zinc ribbon domain-containing protein [Armatimonadetes bacterium]|nr:zinc ribbon domain-containing protein [Armatimonadota bacterium]
MSKPTMPMPPDNEAPTICPNCRNVVPDGAKLCANCGAGVVPLPVLDGGKRVAGAPDAAPPYLTKSHGGDVAVGIAGGILLPPALILLFLVTLGVLTSQVNWNASGGAGSYNGLVITFWGTILLWFGTMVWLVRRVPKIRYRAIVFMGNLLLGWLFVGVISFLGLLGTCLYNSSRP